MNENTTKIIKLANGEDIVCTCMESRNVNQKDNKLLVISPLKMEIRNKVTRKGVVEALTLSRWLQPFSEEDTFELEKSNIVTITDASYALGNYYKFMLDSITSVGSDELGSDNVRLQANIPNDEDDSQEMADDEVRKLFNEYIEKIQGATKDLEPKEDVSEEDLDTMISNSDTKH
tara:strand:- start:1786 stop:2310 length:525 start_codon:yes stop_codon:yes gene_type:complete